MKPPESDDGSGLRGNSEFDGRLDGPLMSAKEQIKRFKEMVEGNEPLFERSEVMIDCLRSVRAEVLSGNLTSETLGEIFQKAHKTEILGTTDLLAYAALFEAAVHGKLTTELFLAVETSVREDTCPFWEGLVGLQEEVNKRVWRGIMMNENLFDAMRDYISPEMFEQGD